MRVGLGISLLAISTAVPLAAQAAAPIPVSRPSGDQLSDKACPRQAALSSPSRLAAVADRKLRYGRPARTMTARL